MATGCQLILALSVQVDAVLEASASLTDRKKMAAEFFDNKIVRHALPFSILQGIWEAASGMRMCLAVSCKVHDPHACKHDLLTMLPIACALLTSPECAGRVTQILLHRALDEQHTSTVIPLGA